MLQRICRLSLFKLYTPIWWDRVLLYAKACVMDIKCQYIHIGYLEHVDQF